MPAPRLESHRLAFHSNGISPQSPPEEISKLLLNVNSFSSHRSLLSPLSSLSPVLCSPPPHTPHSTSSVRAPSIYHLFSVFKLQSFTPSTLFLSSPKLSFNPLSIVSTTVFTLLSLSCSPFLSSPHGANPSSSSPQMR